jgi:hypothetical protein
MPFRTFALAFLFAFLLGCDEPVVDLPAQEVAEIAWRPDGAGFLALVNAYNRRITTTPSIEYPVVKYTASGDRVGTVPTSQGFASLYSPPAIWISDDSRFAFARLGGNLTRFDEAGAEKVLAVQASPFAVSPDGNFAVVTKSPADAPIKTIMFLSLATTPARIIKQWDVSHLSLSRGFWLKDGRVALTHTDGVGSSFVVIYDSSDLRRDTILDASTALHASDYLAAANELYVRTSEGMIDRITLPALARSRYLSESVQSFDVSETGLVSAFTLADTNGVKTLWVQKPGGRIEIARDAFFAALTQDGGRVAYTRSREAYFTEIVVKSLP